MKIKPPNFNPTPCSAGYAIFVYVIYIGYVIPVKLPWVFQGGPLTFNGPPGNIQGNLTAIIMIVAARNFAHLGIWIVCHILFSLFSKRYFPCVGCWWHPLCDIISLIHWGRDKMDAIFQTTFSSAFSWMKMYKFRLKFHWSLFLRVQLTIFQHWFR